MYVQRKEVKHEEGTGMWAGLPPRGDSCGSMEHLTGIQASWALVGGQWAIACVWLVTYIHTDIYIYTYIHIVITITLFFFSIIVNSFISTHEYSCGFLSFHFSPSSHWEGEKWGKWLCGAEPPASLNHITKEMLTHLTPVRNLQCRDSLQPSVSHNIIPTMKKFTPSGELQMFSASWKSWNTAARLLLSLQCAHPCHEAAGRRKCGVFFSLSFPFKVNVKKNGWRTYKQLHYQKLFVVH